MNLFLVCIIDFSEMLLFLFEIVKIIKFDQVVYDISIGNYTVREVLMKNRTRV